MSIRKLGVSFEGAQKTDQSQRQAEQDKSVQQQKEAQERIFNEQRETIQRQNEQKLLEQRHFLKKQQAEKERLQSLESGTTGKNEDLMVSSSVGYTSPVPSGAEGPFLTRAPGSEYRGGYGGNSLPDCVANLRIMDDNSQVTGNPNHRQRSIYTNKFGQPINPETGKPDRANKTHLYHDITKGK